MQNRFIEILDGRFTKEAYLAILSDGTDEIEKKALILKRVALSEKLISSIIEIEPEETTAELKSISKIQTLPCLLIRDKGHDLLDVWDYDDALEKLCFNKKFAVVIGDVDITTTLRKEYEQRELKVRLAELNERMSEEAQMVREEEYRKLDMAVKEWCEFRDVVNAFARSPEGCEEAREADLIRKTERIGQVFQKFCIERLHEIEEPLKETMDKASDLSQKQIQ